MAYEYYNLKYLLHRAAQGQITNALIPDGLKRLSIHDQKKHSNYLETRYTYLCMERNIARTARATYQHRNTLIYQLDRIQEILNLNLHEDDVRLELLITLKMLFHQKQMQTPGTQL